MSRAEYHHTFSERHRVMIIILANLGRLYLMSLGAIFMVLSFLSAKRIVMANLNASHAKPTVQLLLNLTYGNIIMFVVSLAIFVFFWSRLIVEIWYGIDVAIYNHKLRRLNKVSE